MSQPGTSENYSGSPDATDLQNSGSEALRIEELEDLETNPNVESMQPASNGDNDGQHQRRKNARYTERQTQELHAFFKNHPHANHKQREELSRVIGLTPVQIKFWHQNRKNVSRGQHRAQEIARLKSRIEELQVENTALRANCPKCGGGMTLIEQQLMLENAQLKDEIGKILGIASRHIGRPSISTFPHLPSSSHAPQQFQVQSRPTMPTLMLFEGGGMRPSERSYLTSEPTTVAYQSHFGVPSPGAHDACGLTLRIADPREGASRSSKNP